MLNKTRYAEALGTGIARIVRHMDENGSPAPTFEVGEFSFIVKLPKRLDEALQKPAIVNPADPFVLKSNLLVAVNTPQWIKAGNTNVPNYRTIQAAVAKLPILASLFKDKLYFYGDEAKLRNAIQPYEVEKVTQIQLDVATLKRLRGPVNDLYYQGIRRFLISKGLKQAFSKEFFFAGATPRKLRMGQATVDVVKKEGPYLVHEGISISLEHFGDVYYLVLLPRLFITRDGERLAPQEVTKSLLTRLNFRRWNAVVRESAELWRRFLGDGQVICVPLGAEQPNRGEANLTLGAYSLVGRDNSR